MKTSSAGTILLFGTAALTASCGSADEGTPAYLTREQMMDPETCKECHADHYEQWAGSMHAYAADDPVFIAMNKRGQRETQGSLGDFCIQCHAPMAVYTGATTDGLNVADLPAPLKGVTCFFCHAVDAVEGTHNAPLHIADDELMRGPFDDPVANTAHASGYSKLHDRDQLASAKLCGSCHDIVNGHGTAIERTFQEWQGTVFAQPVTGVTCGQCHMEQSAHLKPVAQAPGVYARRFHGHELAGVDLALTPFPGMDEQRAAVQSLLDSTVQSALCVNVVSPRIHVILDNVAAGHSWPSGSAQDRRAWVEVIAYSAGQVIYQSGVVDDMTPVVATADPDLWLMRDCLLDDQQNVVPMFWQAQDYESHLLPGQVTFDPTDPRFYQTHVFRQFPRQTTLAAVPDRVTMRLRLRPMGLDVLEDLVASGDLDPTVAAGITTFDIGAEPLVEWTVDTAQVGYFEGGAPFTCVTNTNLGFAADKVAAPEPVYCQP